ncbi:hypothetical protein CYMTET_35012, partial [Cymbomonas tetramitiformis]
MPAAGYIQVYDDWYQMVQGNLYSVANATNAEELAVSPPFNTSKCHSSSARRLLSGWEGVHPEGRGAHESHIREQQQSTFDQGAVSVGFDPLFHMDRTMEGSLLRGAGVAAPQWKHEPTQQLPADLAL